MDDDSACVFLLVHFALRSSEGGKLTFFRRGGEKGTTNKKRVELRRRTSWGRRKGEGKGRSPISAPEGEEPETNSPCSEHAETNNKGVLPKPNLRPT